MRMMNVVLMSVASMFYQSAQAIPPEAPGGDSNSKQVKKSEPKKPATTKKGPAAKSAKGPKK